MRTFFSRVFFLCLFFLNAHSLHAASKEAFLLAPPCDYEKSKTFQTILQTEPGTQEHEKAKIDFLIERVSKSPYEFVRNGETHPARKAAMHLRWKYMRYKKLASNAENFIEDVASSSRESGSEYLIRVKSGKTHPLRTVFRNELKMLNLAIMRYTKHSSQPLPVSTIELKKDKQAADN
jgi:hypothetical protein